MQFVILNGLECFFKRGKKLMIAITVTKDGLKWLTPMPKIDTERLAMLMKSNPGCTVEPVQGKIADLRTLQDNQSVAKGGENYYFLITRKG